MRRISFNASLDGTGVHISENRNASSATPERRSASNGMNCYRNIRMDGSYPDHSFPNGMREQPSGG